MSVLSRWAPSDEKRNQTIEKILLVAFCLFANWLFGQKPGYYYFSVKSILIDYLNPILIHHPAHPTPGKNVFGATCHQLHFFP
ncbi:MAG: hypothetical protein KBF57_08760 [Saprospiraceae bacterium]|nr:hypothetical protein [Saprospiraceae bacterium]